MAGEFEKNWKQATDRIRFALDGKQKRELRGGDETYWHILVTPAYRPFDGWVVSQMTRDYELETEKLRVFSVSEVPGEMDAFTFYPNFIGVIGDTKIKEAIDANKGSMDMQLDFGMTEPTDADYREFFDVADEIMTRSI